MGKGAPRNSLCLVIATLAALSLVGCNPASPTPAAGPSVFPDAQVGPDWTRVVAPGWPDQGGFSLMLPPGWVLEELQGIDSYVGEVSGDGMTLMFDYGRYSWGLNPGDEPEHEYLVAYEDIGGRRAKLLIDQQASLSTATYEAATAVYFGDLGGRNALILDGRGLNPEQQRIAVAIFRGIRLLE